MITVQELDLFSELKVFWKSIFFVALSYLTLFSSSANLADWGASPGGGDISCQKGEIVPQIIPLKVPRTIQFVP